MVGPSNMPRRSPWTRRRSSRATSRPSSISMGPVGAQVAAPPRPRGRAGRSTTWGRVGAGSRRRGRWPRSSAASIAARSRGSRSRPRQATASDAVSSMRRRHAGPRRARRPAARPRPGGRGVQRVEPDRTARAQGHGTHAPGLGQRAVLALRVDHPGLAAEDGLAPEVGLHERALAPADLPEHHHVGIGHHALPVEDERVVDERAAEEVPPDEHALVPEARPRSPAGRRRPGAGWWPRGPAPGASAAAHDEPPAQREGAGEGHVLLAVEEAQLEPGLAGGLLDCAAGLLRARPARRRSPSRSPRTGTGRARRPARCPVARRFPAPWLVPGGDQEAAPAPELAVGQVGRAGLGHLAGRPDRADRLHDQRDRPPERARTATARGSPG